MLNDAISYAVAKRGNTNVTAQAKRTIAQKLMEGFQLKGSGKVCFRCSMPLMFLQTKPTDDRDEGSFKKTMMEEKPNGICVVCEDDCASAEDFERKLVMFSGLHAKTKDGDPDGDPGGSKEADGSGNKDPNEGKHEANDDDILANETLAHQRDVIHLMEDDHHISPNETEDHDSLGIFYSDSVTSEPTTDTLLLADGNDPPDKGPLLELYGESDDIIMDDVNIIQSSTLSHDAIHIEVRLRRRCKSCAMDIPDYTVGNDGYSLFHHPFGQECPFCHVANLGKTLDASNDDDDDDDDDDNLVVISIATSSSSVAAFCETSLVSCESDDGAARSNSSKVSNALLKDITEYAEEGGEEEAVDSAEEAVDISVKASDMVTEIMEQVAKDVEAEECKSEGAMRDQEDVEVDVEAWENMMHSKAEDDIRAVASAAASATSSSQNRKDDPSTKAKELTKKAQADAIVRKYMDSRYNSSDLKSSKKKPKSGGSKPPLTVICISDDNADGVSFTATADSSSDGHQEESYGATASLSSNGQQEESSAPTSATSEAIAVLATSPRDKTLVVKNLITKFWQCNIQENKERRQQHLEAGRGCNEHTNGYLQEEGRDDSSNINHDLYSEHHARDRELIPPANALVSRRDVDPSTTSSDMAAEGFTRSVSMIDPPSALDPPTINSNRTMVSSLLSFTAGVNVKDADQGANKMVAESQEENLNRRQGRFANGMDPPEDKTATTAPCGIAHHGNGSIIKNDNRLSYKSPYTTIMDASSNHDLNGEISEAPSSRTTTDGISVLTFQEYCDTTSLLIGEKTTIPVSPKDHTVANGISHGELQLLPTMNEDNIRQQLSELELIFTHATATDSGISSSQSRSESHHHPASSQQASSSKGGLATISEGATYCMNTQQLKQGLPLSPTAAARRRRYKEELLAKKAREDNTSGLESSLLSLVSIE